MLIMRSLETPIRGKPFPSWHSIHVPPHFDLGSVAFRHDPRGVRSGQELLEEGKFKHQVRRLGPFQLVEPHLPVQRPRSLEPLLGARGVLKSTSNLRPLLRTNVPCYYQSRLYLCLLLSLSCACQRPHSASKHIDRGRSGAYGCPHASLENRRRESRPAMGTICNLKRGAPLPISTPSRCSLRPG